MTSGVAVSLNRKMQRKWAVQPAFDPFALITGTPNKADDFTTLALDSPVHGRTLTTGGGTWNADAEWVGAGDGVAKLGTAGKAIKNSLAHTDCMVRAIWNPGATGDNQVGVFARDSQSTPFPGSCFYFSSYPAYSGAPPAQAVALYREDTFEFINLTGFLSATIHRGWNMLELRCIGTTISGWLNGVKMCEVTDTGKSGSRGYWGFCHTNKSGGDVLLSYVDFTLL